MNFLIMLPDLRGIYNKKMYNFSIYMSDFFNFPLNLLFFESIKSGIRNSFYAESESLSINFIKFSLFATEEFFITLGIEHPNTRVPPTSKMQLGAIFSTWKPSRFVLSNEYGAWKFKLRERSLGAAVDRKPMGSQLSKWRRVR